MKCRDSHTPVASSRPVICLVLTLLAVAPVGAQEPPRSDEVFKTAVAAWNMARPEDAAGRNELRIVGAARLGVRLEGQDLRESLARGDDGLASAKVRSETNRVSPAPPG